jgi:hypothetical protein
VTEDVFEQSLRAFVRRVPFRPFAIELVSGARYEIQHPEAFVIHGGVAVFLAPDKEIVIFDHEGVSQLTSSTDQATSA